ncbi:MAG: restriction endonuclease subunit S [Desulfuromonadales bacterium]
MSSEWPTFLLSDLITVKHGFAFKGEFFTDEATEYQLTTPGNFAINGGFQIGKGKYYTGPIPEDYILRKGDLIVTMTDLSKAADTLGYAAVIPDTKGTTWLHNQRVGLVQIKSHSKVLPEFLHFLMRSDNYRHWVVASASGSTVKHTSPGRICEFQFNLPSVSEQAQIGSILTALDDRIALLSETNTTLEAIAQALFKSWFVDFDPVRAKQEGREPEGMDADTAALFPDSFEESELGLVPKGWNQVPFTDTVHVIGGGTPKTSMPEYWNGDIPWFSVVDAPTITDVFVIDTQKHITELGLSSSSTKLLAKGTTIISARGTVGRLALVGRQIAMNQSCYGLRGKADDAYFTYFSTYRLVESLKQRSHGSVFDTITTETMNGVFVIYPDKAVIKAFETLLQPVMDRMQNNLEKIQTLATLRDTLLPRLISGQLLLPDAEALVGEV